MSVVYVLLESDNPITPKNPGVPAGVVSSEETANGWYQKDHKRRDYVLFNLDELAIETGVPNSPVPPSELVDYDKLDSTRKKIEDTTKSTQDTMKTLRERLERLKKFSHYQYYM